MVTVETALAIPALLVAAVLAAAVPATVASSVACTDAAREAALLAARDTPAARVQAVVEQIAPAQATVALTRRGDLVQAVVTAEVDVWPVGPPVTLTLRGRAVAAVEP